jgi:hypothetical protein
MSACFFPFILSGNLLWGKNRKAIPDYLVVIHDKNRFFSHSFPLLLWRRGGLSRIDALKSVSIGYNNAGIAFFER